MEDLLAKYFAGEASAEEVEIIKKWRADSKEHARSYLDAKKVWLLSTRVELPNDKFLNEIKSKGGKQHQLKQWPAILKYAAIFLLVVASSILIYQFLQDPVTEIIATKMTNHRLPDGSSVTLQAGSKLSIGNFKVDRTVNLSGRAYFDIKKDKESPFTIMTKSARIQVTGTSFVVNNLVENATEVIVESGSVSLYQNPSAFNGSNMMVSLEEGEVGQLVVGERGIRKKKIRDQNYLAWKTGILTFRNTTIEQVMLTLEDIYGLKIKIVNDDIKYCRLTANYKDKTSNEVLNFISKTFDFSYQLNGMEVTLSGKGCH